MQFTQINVFEYGTERGRRVGGKEENEGEGGELLRRTDPLFLDCLVPSFSPHSVSDFFLSPSLSLSLPDLCGHCLWGRQVLVPTQFPSNEEKNGVRFPFIPYPPQQAGSPACLCSLISGDI